jgi:uncharacterized membrane protein
MDNEWNVLPLAAGFGAIAGLRAFSAPAAISRAARMRGIDLSNTPLQFVSQPNGAHAIAALALGELFADQSKHIPNRTDWPSLIARAASGALAGASIARAKKVGWWPAALTGAAVAIGTSFAGFHLRRLAGESLHLPDRVVGLVEDAIVIGSAVALVSGLSDSK